MYNEFQSENESVRYWMDTLANRAEATKESYLKHLKAFCEALGKTPDELIAQRKQDLKNDDIYVRHRVELLLKKHIANLDKEGASISTQKLRYASVRSFFECHYMRLELRRSDAPSGEPIGKDPATKKDIKRMIDIAEPFRFRCLISFLKDCGWRLGDVLNLTWGDISDIGDGFWNFKKITMKRRVIANGFVGPETTELMLLYRKKREDAGEKMSPNSPLFESETGGSYSVAWVSHKISKIAEMVGAKNVSAHSMRKFFQRTLENPELHIHGTWIKQFMGKKIIGSDRPYVEDRTEKLSEAYRGAYDNLRAVETTSLAELQRRQQIVEELQGKIMAREPLTEEDLAKGRKYNIKFVTRYPKFDKKYKEMLEKASEAKESEEDCPNGHNCPTFKEIPEKELLAHLNQGWQVVHNLQNGRVIVKRLRNQSNLCSFSQ